jgi:hypothetical protein
MSTCYLVARRLRRLRANLAGAAQKCQLLLSRIAMRDPDAKLREVAQKRLTEFEGLTNSLLDQMKKDILGFSKVNSKNQVTSIWQFQQSRLATAISLILNMENTS